MVAARAAKVISLEPTSAESKRDFPISRWRMIFSKTMIASSTTIPIARLNPKRVNVFRVNPAKDKIIKVPTIDVGIESSTLKVEDQEPKNSQQTSAVKSADIKRVKFSSPTESSMKLVLSKLIPSSIPGGRLFDSSLIFFLTPLATATAFEPLCFRIPKPTACFPLARLNRRTSAKPSSIRATLFNGMGVKFGTPPRVLMAIFPKSSGVRASPIVRTLYSLF